MKTSQKIKRAGGLLFLGIALAFAQSGLCAINPPVVVSVTAGQNAVEPGPSGCYGDKGTPGTFTITRSGFLASDLVVYISRGGTATGPRLTQWASPPAACLIEYGIDYSVSYLLPRVCTDHLASDPENIVIPGGGNSSSSTISIYPYFDWECETNETVIITVLAANPVTGADPGYLVAPDAASATNLIINTDTLGSWLAAEKTGIKAGETVNLTCWRTCGCDYTKPMFGLPVTTSFVLVGSARYGIDYLLPTNPPNVTVRVIQVNGVSVPEVTVVLGVSNNAVGFPLTSLDTGDYSKVTRTVLFIPECQYETCCSNVPMTWTTNASGCQYAYGFDGPMLSIGYPLIQPTLDSAEFSNSVFSFNVNGQEGAIYTVSASANLTDWADLASFTMTSSTMKVSDALGGNFPQRFYGVRAGIGTGSGQGLSFEQTTRSLLVRQSPDIYLSGANSTSTGASGSLNMMKQQISPEEEWILIEAERLRLEEAGDPTAILMPPTPLTPRSR